MPTRIKPRPALVPALALLAALAGCREDWQAATYPASGRLTINGRPAAGALVQLFPKAGTAPDERNSRPWGKVAADGSFELSTYQGEAGAPAGEYGVAISWPVDAAVLGSPDRLGGKYNAPEKSSLAVTLKAEPNQIPPFDLAGAKVADAPRPSARTAPPAR